MQELQEQEERRAMQEALARAQGVGANVHPLMAMSPNERQRLEFTPEEMQYFEYKSAKEKNAPGMISSLASGFMGLCNLLIIQSSPRLPQETISSRMRPS